MASIPAKGVLLKGEFNVGSGTFVTIAQRTAVSLGGWEVRTAEDTDLDSSNATYQPSISDSGEISCDFFYDPDNSSHSSLTSLMNSPAVILWEVIFTDTNPTKFSFSGILTGFEPDAGSVDDRVVVSISIKISGAIVIS